MIDKVPSERRTARVLEYWLKLVISIAAAAAAATSDVYLME